MFNGPNDDYFWCSLTFDQFGTLLYSNFRSLLKMSKIKLSRKKTSNYPFLICAVFTFGKINRKKINSKKKMNNRKYKKKKIIKIEYMHFDSSKLYHHRTAGMYNLNKNARWLPFHVTAGQRKRFGNSWRKSKLNAM